MSWRDVDWVKYEAAKRGRDAPKHAVRKPAPSDTRALIHAPEQGLAPFLLDPNLLPKRPPGMR
jgi:hypothetical protein